MPFTLNDANLPYTEPLHPIVVHFVIVMVVFSFICDVMCWVILLVTQDYTILKL